MIDDGDIGRAIGIVVHAKSRDGLAIGVVKGPAKHNRVVHIERAYIGTFRNAFDVRIDSILTLRESLIKWPIVLGAEARVALELPVQPESSRGTVLIDKINDAFMFLEDHNFVKVDDDDVTVQL